ncbi:ABC transporter permease subunit [Crateriforma spongiae]|uniref:ABC transporter permease subunit n=1 Tax=Crateriforma spongiae TaxID=2724528 RepID=UPI0014470964|nr:ABC transporter permease subunit [Crateriforma spongiae]
MIDRVLVGKYVRQSMLLWASCALALFAFAWVRVWVVGMIDMGQFQSVLDLFKDFERFAPIEFSALATHTGRVGMTFDEPIVILCTVIWCVSRGSDVVSGELGRGTLEMVLSQPISRIRLMLSHALVSVIGLALLCLLLWLGIGIGVQLSTVKETLPPQTVTIPWIEVEVPLGGGQPVVETLPMYQRVDVGDFAASVFNLFAFGFFLLGLATMFSSLDRYRWRTIGAVMAIYIVQLVLLGLGKAAEPLNWLQKITFFSCYKPQPLLALVTDGDRWAPWSLTTSMPDAVMPPLMYPLILLAGGAAFYAVALWRFHTRDLPAPL